MIKERRLRTLADMTRLEHRVWGYTAIIDDPDSCWEWEGAKTPQGYPVTSWKSIKLPEGGSRPATDEEARFKGEGTTQSYQVRRVVLWLKNGVMPLFARDTCGNSSCVRPSHLVDD